MAQLGVVAAATISVLSMKCFLIVPCLRRRAPHHCGDPDPSRTIGRTSVVFLKHLGSQRFWKVNKHGAFSIHRKALGLRPNDQKLPSRNVASFGFLLIGATNGPIKLTTTGTFASKNDLRVLEIELKKRSISKVLSGHWLSS